MNKNIGIQFTIRRRVPLVGGYCNNGTKCGARCLNCNNEATISNWNVGATQSYSNKPRIDNVTVFLHLLVEIDPLEARLVSRKPNAVKGIRKVYLMHSFNGLYVAMMDHEEIKESIKEAAKHKTKRREVQNALSNIDEKAVKIANKISTGKWKPPIHKQYILQEGSHKKERTIEKPRWDDEQIVHHMLMRQFRPIIIPRMYRYACGTVPGRGSLYSVRALKRWRDNYNGKKFYVAELDIKKFYDSVDVTVLEKRLDKFIRDKRYLSLLKQVIHSSEYDRGLPKGFYTSPWLANFYLMGLDNYITQELKPNHYLRYMDNMFLFHRNKRELHKMVGNIELYLHDNLHLALNNSKQVYRMEYIDKQGNVRGRAINALGHVIHCNRVTMRKTILKRARSKALRMKRLGRCRRIDAAAMISYKGWFDRTDTYNYYQKWIKPNVSMKYCRRRISKLAKQERRKQKRDKKDQNQNQYQN